MFHSVAVPACMHIHWHNMAVSGKTMKYAINQTYLVSCWINSSICNRICFTCCWRWFRCFTSASTSLHPSSYSRLRFLIVSSTGETAWTLTTLSSAARMVLEILFDRFSSLTIDTSLGHVLEESNEISEIPRKRVKVTTKHMKPKMKTVRRRYVRVRAKEGIQKFHPYNLLCNKCVLL